MLAAPPSRSSHGSTDALARLRGHATGVLALGLALLLGGCASVGATERELLALPEMDPSSEALEHTFHSHVEAAREGSFGGHGTQGGGCGCG